MLRIWDCKNGFVWVVASCTCLAIYFAKWRDNIKLCMYYNITILNFDGWLDHSDCEAQFRGTSIRDVKLPNNKNFPLIKARSPFEERCRCRKSLAFHDHLPVSNTSWGPYIVGTVHETTDDCCRVCVDRGLISRVLPIDSCRRRGHERVNVTVPWQRNSLSKKINLS